MNTLAIQTQPKLDTKKEKWFSRKIMKSIKKTAQAAMMVLWLSSCSNSLDNPWVNDEISKITPDVSLINKEVIDVNTPGGSAIQMASFGFKANDVITDANEDTRPFNDGKKLSFDPKRGSMEVMLSTNFFRDVVP